MRIQAQYILCFKYCINNNLILKLNQKEKSIMSKNKKSFRNCSASYKRRKLALMRFKHNNFYVDMEKYESNVEIEIGSTSNIPLDINELYSNTNDNKDINVNNIVTCKYNDDNQSVFNDITIQKHNIGQNSEDTINCISNIDSTNCNSEQSFALALRTVLIKHNMNHIQSNAMLNVLRTQLFYSLTKKQ